MVGFLEIIYTGLRNSPLPSSLTGVLAYFIIAYYNLRTNGENAAGDFWRFYFQVGIAIATFLLFIFWGDQRFGALIIGTIIIGALYLPIAWNDDTSRGVLSVLAVIIILGFCSFFASLSMGSR